MCVAPKTCACDIGWEGTRCEICLPLPGCKHGYCQNQAFECICQDENSWQGAHCDIRKYIITVVLNYINPRIAVQLCIYSVGNSS